MRNGVVNVNDDLNAGLTRLADAMVEDVLAMTDDEIEAELIAEGVDLETLIKNLDDLFALAISRGEANRHD
jgi:hypothetical protein